MLADLPTSSVLGIVILGSICYAGIICALAVAGLAAGDAYSNHLGTSQSSTEAALKTVIGTLVFLAVVVLMPGYPVVTLALIPLSVICLSPRLGSAIAFGLAFMSIVIAAPANPLLIFLLVIPTTVLALGTGFGAQHA